MIEIVAFIAEFGDIGTHKEAVRKAFGDEELLLVLFGKLDAEPFPIGSAPLPYIDCDVEHRAADDADEFCLREVLLKVQPAQHPLGAHGLIVLHKGDVKTRFFHIARAVSFHKVTARIPVDGGRDDAEAFDAPDVFFYVNLHSRSP